jgi:hypothetical protein
MPNVPPEERVHFELIQLENDDCDDGLVDELKGKKFFEWVKEDLNKNLGQNARRKYETFVGGFLTYHEKYVNDLERKIFFEWCHKGHINFVRIFIFRESSVIADPPKPKGPPPPESTE